MSLLPCSLEPQWSDRFNAWVRHDDQTGTFYAWRPGPDGQHSWVKVTKSLEEQLKASGYRDFWVHLCGAFFWLIVLSQIAPAAAGGVFVLTILAGIFWSWLHIKHERIYNVAMPVAAVAVTAYVIHEIHKEIKSL